MSLPNFFIIGAYKSGTTALHRALRQHPQIFMPENKEPDYFGIPDISDKFGIRKKKKLEWYTRLFKKVSSEIAIGDASPAYLHRVDAASEIQALAPNAKLIFLLRNPVDRVYSHFLFFQTNNFDSIYNDFYEMIAKEERLPRLSTRYLKTGFYAYYMRSFLNFFPQDQILTVLFEDLQANITSLCKEIYSFLSVDPDFIPADTHIKYAKSGIPKNTHIHSLYRMFVASPKVIRIKLKIKPIIDSIISERKRTKMHFSFRENLLHKPELSEEIRTQLVSIYKNDIIELQDLIGRNLSAWLK